MRALLTRYAVWCRASRLRFVIFFGALFFGVLFGLLFLTFTKFVMPQVFSGVARAPSYGEAAFIMILSLAGGALWGWKMWTVIENAEGVSGSAPQPKKLAPLGNLTWFLVWIIVAIALVTIYNMFNAR